MKHIFYWIALIIYAVDEYASSKRKAINQYKRRWKLNRMPNKSIIWLI